MQFQTVLTAEIQKLIYGLQQVLIFLSNNSNKRDTLLDIIF